jgi:hypothetical protein
MLRQTKDLMDHATAANNGETWCVQRLLAEEKIRALRYRVLSTCDGWLGNGALMTTQCIQRGNRSGAAPVVT